MGVWKDLARGACVELLRWLVHHWGDSGKGTCGAGSVEPSWGSKTAFWEKELILCQDKVRELGQAVSEFELVRLELETCKHSSCELWLGISFFIGTFVGALLAFWLQKARALPVETAEVANRERRRVRPSPRRRGGGVVDHGDWD